MKFLKTRVLPLFLSVVLVLSVAVVPASAGFGGPVELEFPAIRPEAFFDSTGTLVESELNRLFGDNSSDHCAFFSEFAYIANKNNWSETSRENLAVLVSYWNTSVGPKYSSTASLATHRLDDGTELSYVRATINDSRLGGSRNNWTWCLNDGAGKILVALPDEDDSITARGQWLQVNQTSANRVEMLPHDELFNAAQDLGCSLFRMGNYWVIKKTMGVTEYVYANADGERFVSQYEEEKWATNQDRPQSNITENGDIVEGDLIQNEIGIDLSGMMVTLPDGTLNLIDKLIYDESTKTYYIDSHDTYETENNYYVTNNYSWTYHINYTSITYIGQTEEYNKYYEVYYELPDGRDSADLTKEDLEQLNLSIDVIPYGRSADDVSLRSLYHFDGDTKDSSYWNYCTEFKWNKGASLTYMDAGVFDGALYLDENEHDFTLTLPSYIGGTDFTFQFRYYQSATPAPVADSSLYFGSNLLARFNGASLLTGGGSEMAPMPVGTWNEICLSRHNGVYRWYLNGVQLRSGSMTTNLDNTIRFVFGNQQQTFKYIDEIRFLNKAVYGDSTYYEPTSVPYDTNLTLVLPDSQVPVADEYWSFNAEGNLFPVHDLTKYYDTGSVFVSSDAELWADFSNVSDDGAYNKSVWYGFTPFTQGSSPTVSAAYISDVDGWRFKSTGSQSVYTDTSFIGTWIQKDSFLTPLYTYDGRDTPYSPYGIQPNKIYTFSVLLASGESRSVTFDVPAYSVDAARSSSINYATFSNGGQIAFVVNESYTRINHPRYLMITPPTGGSLDIVYMELVEGSVPNTGHEFVESVTVFDKSEMNTPTLAVRTDIGITSYQIGGVRPSLPEKGQVWAMVENDRIVSIQIYNGQAWEGVDGRIWTGQRWIPASSYNIITLQDMYDIVDATPNYEYIYSEAGFWAWWQKSWNAFTEKLFLTLGAGGAAGGTSINPDKLPSVPDDESTVEDDGWSFVELLVVLKDGTWNVITGVVSTAYDGFYGFVQAVSDSGSFFDYYDPDNEQSIFFIPLEEGASVWD